MGAGKFLSHWMGSRRQSAGWEGVGKFSEGWNSISRNHDEVEEGKIYETKPSGLINFWRFFPLVSFLTFSSLVEFYVKSSLLLDLSFMLLFSISIAKEMEFCHVRFCKKSYNEPSGKTMKNIGNHSKNRFITSEQFSALSILDWFWFIFKSNSFKVLFQRSSTQMFVQY